MVMEKKEIKVTAELVGRLDKGVQSLVARSRSQIRGLIDHQCVSLNGELITDGSYILSEGDLITVCYDPRQNYPEKPHGKAGSAFKILYEDDSILVVDKAAMILTVPTKHHETNTLVHQLQSYINIGRRWRGRIEVVHRLDRGVSGVLVFAKNRLIQKLLKDQFAEHHPARIYVGIVAGNMESQTGCFRKNIMDDDVTIHRYCTEDPLQGENAVTHYKVLNMIKGATTVQIRLETGRRNQIRVHFADAGHPVLGDPRYSKEQAKHILWNVPRIALHAMTLEFTHPKTNRLLKFKSDLPVEFFPFMKKINDSKKK